MGFSQSILQLSAALLILSLIEINAQGLPNTHLVSPCLSTSPHILIDLVILPVSDLVCSLSTTAASPTATTYWMRLHGPALERDLAA